MKPLHQADLFGWSVFNEEKNMDFNGVFWHRPGGNVVVDPVEVSSHDAEHMAALGGVAWIVITNGDHLRAVETLRESTGAQVAGPAGEQESLALTCDTWLAEGDSLVDGLVALELHGSKTPGELALLLNGHTLITGDLVRAPRGGSLVMLPDAKLQDRDKAIASVVRLAEIPGIEAVLVGDGWPVFCDGQARLAELAARLA